MEGVEQCLCFREPGGECCRRTDENRGKLSNLFTTVVSSVVLADRKEVCVKVVASGETFIFCSAEGSNGLHSEPAQRKAGWADIGKSGQILAGRASMKMARLKMGAGTPLSSKMASCRMNHPLLAGHKMVELADIVGDGE